ncbi:MAG: pilus assembly protein CpaF, partial [Actinomycetota bacterium]|nr:pilus assembly protein CpaF [Actinomycetota bacterium]
ALDMLQAMNTGHEGSLSTCHANTPDDALRRLETMVLMGDVALPLAAVRGQVEAALDLVVQIARRPDGSRRIVAVAEVVERATWAAGHGEDGREPPRTRSIADADGVLALPLRPARAPGCLPPDPGWARS